MRTQNECPPYGQLQQWCLFVLGISQPIPYNPRLHSQHGLILFNLHPRNPTPGLCTRMSKGFVLLYRVWIQTQRLQPYHWLRTAWRPLRPPCWPHTPGCGSGRAPWSSRSADSPPPSCQRWSPLSWQPLEHPIGWHWAGVSTCWGVAELLFSHIFLSLFHLRTDSGRKLQSNGICSTNWCYSLIFPPPSTDVINCE